MNRPANQSRPDPAALDRLDETQGTDLPPEDPLRDSR
jgi:hypothetical protein